MSDHFAGPPEKAGHETPATVTLIERSIVLLLVIGLLIGVVAVLRPFTTAILFGAALAIAAWPLRRAAVRRGLRRGVVATLLLLLSVAVIALPVILVGPAITEQLRQALEHITAYFAAAPKSPDWLAGVPFVGHRLTAAWDAIVKAGGNLRTALDPYSAVVREWLLGAGRALADSVVQVILSLIVATMFWVSGDTLVSELRDIFRRLGGATADQVLDAAAGAVRSVAYGVVGTAVIQAGLLTAGLAVAGLPGAAPLGFIALLLAISQIGAPLIVLIWGGAAWKLFAQGEQAWGIFMIGWGIVVSAIDNIVKPWLIGFGVRMPLSLVILGVFGGFIAFGFLGLFIGPTLIAVAFTLLQAWRGAAAPRP